MFVSRITPEVMKAIPLGGNVARGFRNNGFDRLDPGISRMAQK